MAVSDSKQRFSARVENYVRYRPGYPPEVLQLLKDECGLTADSVVAEMASGTGIFTRLLLENGNRVFGVEPNLEMRQAGEAFLADYANFISVPGSAEGTTLPAASVDMVTAAQAAHWFDLPKARQEFVRILKPGGWVVLLWNERSTDATPFLQGYEQLVLTYGTDYKEVRHERTTAEIPRFFAPSASRVREFAVHQECDYPALEGRLLSSSYVPHPGHEMYGPMLRDLRGLYDQNQVAGRVVIPYCTRVYFGKLT
jgi:SAM-dependent methyltransferase